MIRATFLPDLIGLPCLCEPVVRRSPLQLRLHLVCALTADNCGSEGDAYEFMTGAFTTYEEEISDSREQLIAVKLAAATLHHTRHVAVRRLPPRASLRRGICHSLAA